VALAQAVQGLAEMTVLGPVQSLARRQIQLVGHSVERRRNHQERPVFAPPLGNGGGGAAELRPACEKASSNLEDGEA
jgi:hypothetical protein